jgi:hypothetical protein
MHQLQDLSFLEVESKCIKFPFPNVGFAFDRPHLLYDDQNLLPASH